MVLHQAFRARHYLNSGFGGEVLHGVTSGVLCETSTNMDVTPHRHNVTTYPRLTFVYFHALGMKNQTYII